jgi:hypothetical protein
MKNLIHTRFDPNGLQDELIRHVQEDTKMSSFDFGVQFLEAEGFTIERISAINKG